MLGRADAIVGIEVGEAQVRGPEPIDLIEHCGGRLLASFRRNRAVLEELFRRFLALLSSVRPDSSFAVCQSASVIPAKRK